MILTEKDVVELLNDADVRLGMAIGAFVLLCVEAMFIALIELLTRGETRDDQTILRELSAFRTEKR